MKKRYPFSLKNCLSLGLLAALLVFVSPDLQAQIGPAKQWDKTFGGSENDALFSLQQTTDGGYILGGTSGSGLNGDKTQASHGLTDFWVVKLDFNGNKQWDKTFGGNNNENLFSLQQTADGGYILGGSSESGISGDKTQANLGSEDYWVIKLDANGNKIWDKTFGGNGFDRLISLQQTTDGGYILGGNSNTGINGDKSQVSIGASDFWVIKLDTNGNKIWDKTIGGLDNENFYSLQQTTDGGYILVGNSGSGIGGNKSHASRGGDDFWVIKLNSNGNILWDKTFGGTGIEFFPKIKQTSDGGYILGGRSDSAIGGDKSQASKGNYDYWVLKLNASGNKSWDKTFGGSDADYLAALQQTADGGFILGGSSFSGISGDKTQNHKGAFDYWVVKLDGTGNKLWDKTIGGGNMESLADLQQTSDGGYILGGSSLSGISGDKSQASKGNYDFWIVKLAPDVLSTSKTKPTFALTLSPNPSHGKFNLHLNGLTAPTADVTVTDLLGRVVLQQQFKTSAGLISEEITLPAAKGMYLVQIKAGGQVTSRKVVVE